MPTLDEALRRALAEDADRAPAPPSQFVPSAQPRAGERRFPRILVAAAAVTLLVGGVVAVAAVARRGTHGPAVDPAPTGPPTSAPAVPLQPVVVSAQPGSRAMYNEVLDANLDDETPRVDREAFFAAEVDFVVPPDLVLPSAIPTYATSARPLPSDATLDAIARSLGVSVPVSQRTTSDPALIEWEAFDSASGKWFTASGTGAFSFEGPVPIVEGFGTTTGDTGEWCELTAEPVPTMSRDDCPGDIAVVVDTVALPSESDAEQLAAQVVAASAPEVGELTFRTTTDPHPPFPKVTVIAEPVDRSQPYEARFEFGADGALFRAQGDIGLPGSAEPAKLIDLPEAVERLEDPYWRWLSPADYDFDLPVPTDPMPPREVIIADVTPDLWYGTTSDGGSGYYLPAYGFLDEEGNRYVVPAITDGLLVIARDS